MLQCIERLSTSRVIKDGTSLCLRSSPKRGTGCTPTPEGTAYAAQAGAVLGISQTLLGLLPLNIFNRM
jgi:hypothetical protein